MLFIRLVSHRYKAASQIPGKNHWHREIKKIEYGMQGAGDEMYHTLCGPTGPLNDCSTSACVILICQLRGPCWKSVLTRCAVS